VHATTLTGVVTVSAPGTGTPTGTVVFVVDGSVVGSSALSGGQASLTYTVPHDGATHLVQAVYQGNGDLVGSVGSATRRDPTVTATVGFDHDVTAFGWYRSPVTVTFTCTVGSAPLVEGCPSPVTLAGSAAGQSVSRTVTATDGGSTTVTVGDLDIDSVAPTVAIAGIVDGATYPKHKHPRCIGADALSGLDTCTIDQVVHGHKVKVTATATDRAGNVSTTTATYKVKKPRKHH
jgi:hypothetical protein